MTNDQGSGYGMICPCTLAGPCAPNCTCADPLQSGGCRCCATYGDIEQRRARAKYIFELLRAGFEAKTAIPERPNQCAEHGVGFGDSQSPLSPDVDVGFDLSPEVHAAGDKMIEDLGPELKARALAAMPEHLLAHWEQLKKERDDALVQVQTLRGELWAIRKANGSALVEPPRSTEGASEIIQDVRWMFAETEDAERWHGPYDSLEEALKEAREDYAGLCKHFWVDEAHPIDWARVARSFACADDVLDGFAQYSKAAAQAAFELWCSSHLHMRAYWQCNGKAQVYPVAAPTTPEPNEQASS